MSLSKQKNTELWNIIIQIPESMEDVYRHVLECICESVSWDADPKDGNIIFKGIYREDGTLRHPQSIIEEFCHHSDLPPPKFLSVEILPHKSWLEENQQSFPPQKIGNFFIYNSFYKDLLPLDLFPIHVDAALAFGSGEHATTQGCLKELSWIKDQNFIPKNALDMGCGSGILAIAVAKLWKCPVVAVDNDPIASETACDNTILNKVDHLVSTQCGDGYAVLSPSESFDLIVSNILAGPLCQMSQDLVGHLNPGGHAILAGLLESQAEEVIKSHVDKGLDHLDTLIIDNWAILLLKKNHVF